MKLKDTFKAGVLASQLKATWLNAVAWCINTLHGGTHINVEIPAKAGEGTGIKVGIDMDGLCADLRNRGFQSKTSTDYGSGTTDKTKGNLAAFGEDGEIVDSGQKKPEENHGYVQAKIDSLTTGNLVKAGTGDDIVDSGINADDVLEKQDAKKLYAEKSHNHEAVYAAKSHTHTEYAATGHNHDSAYAAKSHTHMGYASAGHNHDSVYAKTSHNHDSVYAKTSHTHTLDGIVDESCTASCVALCNNGQFGHSGSTLKNADNMGGDWPVLKSIANAFTKVGTVLKLNISNMTGGSLSRSKFLATDASGNITTPTKQPPSVDASSTEGDFVAVDKNGNLYTPTDQPITVDTTVEQTEEMVMVISKGASSPSLAKGITVKNPTSTTNITSGAQAQASRLPLTDQGKTFGAPGAAGIIVHIACRAVSDGKDGSIYFRPFKITSDGRIYSIGAEQSPAFTCFTG